MSTNHFVWKHPGFNWALVWQVIGKISFLFLDNWIGEGWIQTLYVSVWNIGRCQLGGKIKN